MRKAKAMDHSAFNGSSVICFWKLKLHVFVGRSSLRPVAVTPEVCRKVMFLHVSVFTGRVYPSIHCQFQGRHPLGRHRHPPGQSVNKRAVRILLECNIVCHRFCPLTSVKIRSSTALYAWYFSRRRILRTILRFLWRSWKMTSVCSRMRWRNWSQTTHSRTTDSS